MFPCQAYPWKDQFCCGFYLTVAGRTRTSRSALPREFRSVATKARSALSTMESSLGPSIVRLYEDNQTRFVAFVQDRDRKRHYLPASSNTILIFCVCSISRRKGKHPVPESTQDLPVGHCRKAQFLSLPRSHSGLFRSEDW